MPKNQKTLLKKKTRTDIQLHYYNRPRRTITSRLVNNGKMTKTGVAFYSTHPVSLKPKLINDVKNILAKRKVEKSYVDKSKTESEFCIHLARIFYAEEINVA